jgi:protein-tyrosine phosphatase
MKILMVCLGNICRSPLAEGIMRHKIKEHDLDWEVDSAGTGGWHEGEMPDVRSIAVARKYGINITDQAARKLQLSDFNEFDLIFAMDLQNQRDILRLTKNAAYRKKVHLILNIPYPNSQKEVPDPYHGDMERFQNVYNILDEACEAVVKSALSL